MTQDIPTVGELQEFEKEIAAIYATGVIRGPIHLRDGCETQLRTIFQEIRPDDYVLTAWASHLHALLHGVPRDLVKQRICDGKSIALCFPEHRFYSSAIVGGIAPIATGIGLGIQRRGGSQRVWVFVGDMTYRTGVVQEAIHYCANWQLPVTFVVEDNGKSVGTPTAKAWNRELGPLNDVERVDLPNVRYYNYTLTYPHSGIGTFISF